MGSDRIRETIRRSLGLPQLDANARMGSVRGWTSLRHVRLLLDLERELGVRVPVERFGALTSVPAIVAFFEKGANSSSDRAA